MHRIKRLIFIKCCGGSRRKNKKSFFKYMCKLRYTRLVILKSHSVFPFSCFANEEKICECHLMNHSTSMEDLAVQKIQLEIEYLQLKIKKLKGKN